MFRARTTAEWVQAFKQFSEVFSDEDIELTLFGGAIDWPRAIIEEVRDIFTSTRPELANRIDSRLN